MNCGLCKHPIRGDERYTTDHYKCSAELTESFNGDIVQLVREVQAMREQRDELFSALKLVVSSGAPCQREHPSMWDAWQKAIGVIEKAADL